MVSAAVFAVVLYHPSSPSSGAISNELVRRALMGLAMGLTAVAIIYSPWGQRSGAHMNPAVTLTFFRLGKVARPDFVGYVTAQFAGAIVGIAVGRRCSRRRGLGSVCQLRRRPCPGRQATPWHSSPRLLISFVLMLTVLTVSNHPRLAPFTGVCAGLLVWTYITVEAPLSGMSMNPARTFGSALLARDFPGLWIYFTAPPLGMLLAAELFTRRFGRATGCSAPSCTTLTTARASSAAARARPFSSGRRDRRPSATRLETFGLSRASKHRPFGYARWPDPGRDNESTGMTHYDVIIIGTGAGGGTLAYHLAPIRQADPAARARRLRAAREGQLELAGGQRRGEVPHEGSVAGQGRQAAASAHQLLRRRQHQVLRRRAVPPARGGLRRDPPPRRRLAGVADRLRRARAVLHAGRAPVPGARRARRRSDRAAGQRAVPLPGRAARAAHPAAARRPVAPRACGPFHVPLGDHARRVEPAAEPLHPLRHLRRLPVPGARQVRRPGALRRSGARASERRRCSPTPTCHAAARPARRAARSPASSVERDGADEMLLGRHRRGRRAARSTRRRCCCARRTTGTRTAWPTARTSSAATTWATSTRC